MALKAPSNPTFLIIQDYNELYEESLLCPPYKQMVPIHFEPFQHKSFSTSAAALPHRSCSLCVSCSHFLLFIRLHGWASTPTVHCSLIF